MNATWLKLLLEVSADDPDEARRRQLLNILLLGLAVLTLLTLVVTGAVTASNLADPDSSALLAFLGSLTVVAGIVLVFIVNRYWSDLVASSLFLLLLTTIITFSDHPAKVVEGRSTFLFTIPILMASVILRPWASFALAGLSSAMIAAVALRLPQYIPPFPTMLGFLAFAFIAWVSSRSLENAVRELRAVNRELDERVEARTRELREANIQLAQANESLMELDRLKSRFVSTVSHELRTPLGVVQGFTEMLLDGVYGSLADKQRNALDRIDRNTRTLQNIVNDLLDQARIEAGQLSLRFAPFRPGELAREVESTMGVLAEREGLALTTSVDPGLPDALYGDRERLLQILLNLVTNAIKFTEEGGIHVRMVLPDGVQSSHWAIDVADTGPGIPEEDREAIFVPFRRLDESMTRRHRGVGLGLSIVKQLVEIMEGTISVSSELGQGSTFTVLLPLKRARKE